MKRTILGAAALLTLASCATAPQDSCTRDWFEFRSDEIQRDFVRRNRGPVRRLNTLKTDLEAHPDVFTMLALASAKRDLTEVVNDFRDRVVPEARAIATQCEIDEAFDIVVNAFLAEQGIDADLVRTLGLLGAFEGTPGIASALTGETDRGLVPTDGPLPLQPMPRPSVKPAPRPSAEGGVEGRSAL
jgi:hypothetical protein